MSPRQRKGIIYYEEDQELSDDAYRALMRTHAPVNFVSHYDGKGTWTIEAGSELREGRKQ